jgi:hypothetical protein
VLEGRNGKQASRSDQRDLALTLKAKQLDEGGCGGGVVDLLLASSTPEEIHKLREKYIVKVVLGRGAGECLTVNQECRQAVADDHLMVKLAVLFEVEAASSNKKMSAVVREFSVWISSELKNPDSQAYQIVEKPYPSLISRQRSSSWWEKQIASRRKAAS